jgi:trehalose 6-phosphate phosphatase
VITGRSRSDVASRLEGAAVRHNVGNHGADLALTGDLGEREMATVRDECRRVLGEDVEIEDKGNSLSLHYRHASDPSEAKRSIEACLASLSVSVRVVPGIMVYNVSSEGSPNKGTALVALLEREKIERAIFVGDDFTDEDAFASLPPEKLLSVRVGWRGTSSARYFLEDQADIDAMLEAIVGLQG